MWWQNQVLTVGMVYGHGLWARWSWAGVAEGRWTVRKWEYSDFNALNARWGPARMCLGPGFCCSRGYRELLGEILPSRRRPDQSVPAVLFWPDQWLPVLMCCLICFKIRAVQRVYSSEDKLHATDQSSRAKNVHSLLLSSQLYSVSFHFL